MSARKKTTDINLVLREDFEETFTGQVLSWALTYGRYIIIITQIVVLSVFFLRFKVDRDHTDLKEAVTQKQALVESLADLENDIKGVQTRLSLIRQISTNQDLSLKILRFLQDNTPVDTTFYTLSLNSERLSLNAASDNLRSFSFFLHKLQQDKKFTDVSLEDIVRRSDGKIEFKINVKFNPGEFK